jgi:cell division protein FtsA
MGLAPLVALDIGATKVACAVGLPREGAAGFELLGTGVVPYPASTGSWLSDPLLIGQAIEQALDATALSVEAHAALVAVNHPMLQREHTRVSVALGDEPVTVRAQDLERLARSAIDRTLAVDREPLLVERLGCAGNGFDGVRDPRGLSATRLAGTFHLVTMPVAARRALVQAVESAGLEVARLTYTLPAALASLTDGDVGQKRVVLIDLGGLSMDIGLFVDGVLHDLEVVPSGGVQLAAAVAARGRVSVDQAMAWALQGSACRKPDARAAIEEQWRSCGDALGRILKGQPRPDAVFVAGRAALADGFAEWIERATGVPTSLCRSPRTSTLQDLSRQISLTVPIGLLELATRSAAASPRSGSFLNRLIARTRTILTEYF